MRSADAPGQTSSAPPSSVSTVPSSELQERESSKHEAVADAMAAALRDRGIEATTAVLLARSGAALFRTAFESWTRDHGKRSLASHVEETVTQLQTLWR